MGSRLGSRSRARSAKREGTSALDEELQTTPQVTRQIEPDDTPPGQRRHGERAMSASSPVTYPHQTFEKLKGILMQTTAQKALAELKRLESEGIDLAGQDQRYRQTIIFWLAKQERASVIKYLVEEVRCDINHRDKSEQTALFYAARYSSAQNVKELLELKADPKLQDKNGLTPLCWATSIEIAQALLKADTSSLMVRDEQNDPPAETHRKCRRAELAMYVRLCHHLATKTLLAPVKERAWSWLAIRAPGGGKDAFAGYHTMLAPHTTAIITQLAVLENEFIDEHRELYGPGCDEKELFSGIGLNQNALLRTRAIQDITKAAPAKSENRRMTTMACFHTKPTPKAMGSPQCVGYLFFHMVREDKKTKSDRGSHLIVSHLKVSQDHQQRGVGRLLILGMINFALKEHGDIPYSSLHLSVANKNHKALRLYTNAGFEPDDEDELNKEELTWTSFSWAPKAPPAKAIRSIHDQILRDLPGAAGTAELPEVVSEEEEEVPPPRPKKPRR